MFGKNFTNVSTSELECFLQKKALESNKGTDIEYGVDDVEDAVVPCSKAMPEDKKKNYEPLYTTDNPYEAVCLAIVVTMKDLGVLDDILKKL